MRTRFLTVLTVSLALMNFACEKKQDEAPAEAKPAAEAAKPAAERPSRPMPKSLEELESIKSTISKEDYENVKKRLEAIATKEQQLFKKWSPEQIEFYKAAKAHSPGQDTAKLGEMYLKLPVDKRFNGAYPMPYDEKLVSSDEEEAKYGGVMWSPVNSSNRNSTIFYDQAPYVNYSFFDYHVLKAGEAKTISVDARAGGFVMVVPSIDVGAADLEKSVGLDFQKAVSFKLGGKDLEKVPAKVASLQLAMGNGVQGLWDMKNSFRKTKPSSVTGQYFKIPEQTAGPVELSVNLADTANPLLKSSSYYVAVIEFGFTILTTYTVPKYVETGQEIKLVAKVEKDGAAEKGFSIDGAYFYDFVKNENVPVKFTEVSDGVFEAPFKVPFDGREYAESRADNRLQYFFRATKKGEKATLGRANQNHVYYHSSYCKANGVKDWEYKKGEGLFLTLDVDVLKKEDGAKYRAQFELASKDGHSVAHSLYTVKELKIGDDNKFLPKLFIHDRALFWPGSPLTPEAVAKGDFKVLAVASVITPSMKVITGESCNTYTWWDAPAKQ